MPVEQEPIEPPATWLARAREELKFGEASLGTDPRDARTAALILASIEVDNLPEPVCGRDQDGAVLIHWCHQASDDQHRCLTIRIEDQKFYFSRHLNARPLAIARTMLAKGTPAAVRELLQWLFTSDIHRRVEDVAELLQGDSDGRSS